MQKTEILILKADEGKWLYHDEVDSEGKVTRNFVKGVHNADLEDWTECTNEEKEAYEEEERKKWELEHPEVAEEEARLRAEAEANATQETVEEAQVVE